MNDYPGGFGPPRCADAMDVDPVSAVRRRWHHLVAAVLLCAGIAWGLASLRTESYTSSTEITLQPLTGAPLSPSTRNTLEQASAMNSEADSVASGQVVKAVSRALGMHLDVGTSAIGTHVVSNTHSLVISFTAPTPALAQRGARVVAETFLQDRSDTARQSLVAQLHRVTAEVRAAASRFAGSPRLRAQLIRYASQIEVFGPKLRDIRTVDADPGTVTSEATRPSPAGWAASAYAALGGLIGLVFAVGVVLWRTRREPLVRGRVLTAVSGCPVLAVVPYADEGAVEDGVLNAYRYVRTALLGRPAGATAVAPVGDRDGEPQPVVDALAVSLAQAGASVAHLDVDQAGPVAGPRVRSELSRLRAAHDVVLATAPPACTSDGEAVAVATRQVLLTAVEGETSLRHCRRAITRLRRLGVSVVGLVVLPAPTGGLP